jgi:hypothetical protein
MWSLPSSTVVKAALVGDAVLAGAGVAVAVGAVLAAAPELEQLAMSPTHIVSASARQISVLHLFTFYSLLFIWLGVFNHLRLYMKPIENASNFINIRPIMNNLANTMNNNSFMTLYRRWGCSKTRQAFCCSPSRMFRQSMLV